MKNIPIGEVLKESGKINEEQLQIALEAQKNDRSKRLGEHLIDLGFITESEMLEALSAKLGCPIINIGRQTFDIKSVMLIPKAISQKYSILAIREEDHHLLVVTSDPLNFYGIEDVRLVTGKHLKVCIAKKQEIEVAIAHYYKEVDALNMAKRANVITPEIVSKVETFDAEKDDTPVVKLLNSLLSRGFDKNASDIHIEPFEEKVIVRMRIDGVIQNYVELNKGILASLVVRIKIMSNLDIAEKRVPQDGHFICTIDGNEMNLRVSIIPTIHGEKIVLRYLNTNAQINNEESFGMNKDNYDKMSSILNMPHGIIYVTGPTGSGKTTTLYMMLEALAKNSVNISTIEDPVERNLEKINQMQVNNVAGLTFDTGLRALLRQDPDVIMVGETRDKETAQTSVTASITGHLVLSTLHTNDAVGAIVRLEDMGIEPYMVANSLVGVVAQRLVRKICPHCKIEVEATVNERLALESRVDRVYVGAGCPHCNETGYSGRIAVHEIIVIDSNVRKMITMRKDADEITKYLKENQGLVTLKDGAIELVKNGITTIDELNKITCFVE